MFLSIKEMKKYKFRYGLVIAVIMLISYLVFVLTGLAYGLADSNRQAVDSWDAQQIVLNRDADGSLTQSNLTKDQQKAIDTRGNRSDLMQINANIQKSHQSDKVGTQVLGINKNQSIGKKIKIIDGRMFKNNREVIVDQSLIQENHYQLGEMVHFSKYSPKFKIVGITKNQKLNVAPVVYTTISAVRQLKFGTANNDALSAVVFQKNGKSINNDDLQTLSIESFIQKIPGYSAQNSTFEFMIAFLLLITMFIIAIFLYILTIQKIPFFAVMKIQGISNWYLMKGVVGQAVLLTILGLLVSGGLTLLTALTLPAAVPIQFNIALILGTVVIMLVMSIVGSIIPVRTITKIDPATVIGG